MKLHNLAARAAIVLAAGAAFPSLAFAAVDPFYGSDTDLDQACSDIQKPSDNSGFVSFADNIQITGTSTLTEKLGLISTVGIGTPVSTYSGFVGAHVNGKSVNIHAYAKLSVVYAQGALETYQTKVTTTTTRSSTCHVHKQDAGAQTDTPHPGYSIAPTGLQTAATVSATSVEITYGTTTEVIPGPWTDPNAGGNNEEVVICISPGRNPGNWRAQNGYDGSLGTCSRAWYDTLGATPSVSVPAT